jgi:RimJ/RimL family protein N-acetyltransferase
MISGDEKLSLERGLVLRIIQPSEVSVFHRILEENKAFFNRGGAEFKQVNYPEEILEQRAFHFGLWKFQEALGVFSIRPTSNPEIFSVGYWLKEEATGRGYARLTLGQLLKYFSSLIPVKEFEATTAVQNSKSIKLLESLGFENRGILEGHFLVNGKPVDDARMVLEVQSLS